MTQFSASGSATVKRLRNGETLYLTLEGNGVPLFQGIDPSALSPTPIPSWKVEANQPEETPKVTSSRGSTVKISNHSWKYNGVALEFTGATDGAYTKDSTGKFKMNKSTGALRIIDDLASTSNYANDVLTYSCLATVGDLTFEMTRDREISIVRMGAATYSGALVATKMQIGTGETSVITSSLYSGTGAVSNYYMKWYKNNESSEIMKFASKKQITVGRDDVDGSTLFIGCFFANSTSNEPLAKVGIRIVDNNDEYMVVFTFVSSNRIVDEGKPVTLKGQIVNTTTNSIVDTANANPKWKITAYDTQNWQKTQEVHTDTITITTADTDRSVEITNANGSKQKVEQQNDIELVGEVEFTL